MWLLKGLTGSTPALLELTGDRVRLTLFGKGALTRGQCRALERETGIAGLAQKLRDNVKTVTCDAAVDEITDCRFPWYYFGGGMHLRVGSVRFRLSFLQPQNVTMNRMMGLSRQGAGSISAGRRAGAEWRAAFAAIRTP